MWCKVFRAPSALVSLSLLALSSGCDSGQVPVAALGRKPPPELVTPCRQHPVPGKLASDNELALYLIELADAGEDCRQRHRALARWAKEE